jgi:hypothetical protein
LSWNWFGHGLVISNDLCYGGHRLNSGNWLPSCLELNIWILSLCCCCSNLHGLSGVNIFVKCSLSVRHRSLSVINHSCLQQHLLANHKKSFDKNVTGINIASLSTKVILLIINILTGFMACDNRANKTPFRLVIDLHTCIITYVSWKHPKHAQIIMFFYIVGG